MDGGCVDALMKMGEMDAQVIGCQMDGDAMMMEGCIDVVMCKPTAM